MGAIAQEARQPDLTPGHRLAPGAKKRLAVGGFSCKSGSSPRPAMPSLDRIIANLQDYLARECPGEEFDFSTGDEGGFSWFRELEYVQISHVIRSDGVDAAMVMLARISRKRIAETRLELGNVASVEFFGDYGPDRQRPEADRVFSEARLWAAAEGKLKTRLRPAAAGAAARRRADPLTR